MSKLLYLTDDEYATLMDALKFMDIGMFAGVVQGDISAHRDLLNKCILLYGDTEEEIEEEENE